MSARIRLRLLPGEAGFSMIEVVIAAVLFLVVATSMTGVMTSAIASHTVSKERTKGVQILQNQLERITALAYSDTGTVGGYPSGVIPAAGWDVPTGYTVQIAVLFINDPGPTSLKVVANYKKVTVAVTRTKDGKELAKESTYKSPPSRPQYGGVNYANVTITVADWALNTPVAGATVFLKDGPPGNLSLVTDDIGQSPFLGISPTTTPPNDFYNVTVAKSGYETFASDVPPSGSAHFALAPTESRSSTIRIFKRATIKINLRNASGTAYTGAATIKVKSAATGAWTTFTTTNGTLPDISALGSNPVLPKVLYTVRAFTTTGLCSGDVQKNVPDNYPTTLTSTFTLTLSTCPSGTVNVNVKQLAANINGATVTLSGGPNDVSVTATTNTSGNVTFNNVPSHVSDGYTVSATRTVQGTAYTKATTTPVIVATGGTSSVNLALPDPALATVSVTVTVAGTPQSGATVVLSGSPWGLANLTGTTVGGVATFTNIPIGTGYTATASLSPYANGTATIAVTAPTTDATVVMPAGLLTVNTSWAGKPVLSAPVTVTNGTTILSGTTDATTGVKTFIVPTGTWNATVTKNGFTGTGSAAVTTGGGTINVTNFPTGTITVSSSWGNMFAVGANVSVAGGPNGGTYTGVIGSGGSVVITVPATTATYPYTVSVTKTTTMGNGTATPVGGVVVSSGLNTNVTVNLTPTKTFTLTIKRNGTAVAAGTRIDLSITGGPNGTAGAQPAYAVTLTALTGGVLPAVTVPLGTSGSTYTIKANLTATTCVTGAANQSGSVTGQSNTGANTNVTIDMKTSTCPFSPLP